MQPTMYDITDVNVLEVYMGKAVNIGIASNKWIPFTAERFKKYRSHQKMLQIKIICN